MNSYWYKSGHEGHTFKGYYVILVEMSELRMLIFSITKYARCIFFYSVSHMTSHYLFTMLFVQESVTFQKIFFLKDSITFPKSIFFKEKKCLFLKVRYFSKRKMFKHQLLFKKCWLKNQLFFKICIFWKVSCFCFTEHPSLWVLNDGTCLLLGMIVCC